MTSEEAVANEVEKDKRDLATAILLEHLVRNSYEERASTAIQPLQWSILRYVAEADLEPRTMSQVAKFLGLTQAPVIRAIQTLMKKGLLTQESNPSDRRSKFLRLTEKGIQNMKNDPIYRLTARMERLPQKDREALRYLVRALTLH